MVILYFYGIFIILMVINELMILSLITIAKSLLNKFSLLLSCDVLQEPIQKKKKKILEKIMNI